MTDTPTHHFVLSRVVTDGLDDNASATAEAEVKNLFQLACLAGVACQPVDISVQLTDALTEAIDQFNVQHGIAAPPFDRTRPQGISFAKVLAVPSQSSTSSYVIVLDSALWSQSSAENVVYRAHGLARLLSHIVVKHQAGRATPIPKTALGPYAFSLWQRVSVLCDAWDEQVTAVGICNACLRDQEGNAVPLTEFVGGQSMQMVSEFLDQLCIFASFDVQFYRVTAIGLDDLPPTALSLSMGLLASVLEAASLFAACSKFEQFCSAVSCMNGFDEFLEPIWATIINGCISEDSHALRHALTEAVVVLFDRLGLQIEDMDDGDLYVHVHEPAMCSWKESEEVLEE